MIQLGNLLKWSCHLDNIHWAKQIFSASKHIYYWTCVSLRGFCLSSVFVCACVCVCACACQCLFVCECKPWSSSVPVLMGVGLAGGHHCMTIGALVADLIKVNQSHSSWLEETASYTHTHTLTAPCSSSQPPSPPVYPHLQSCPPWVQWMTQEEFQQTGPCDQSPDYLGCHFSR